LPLKPPSHSSDTFNMDNYKTLTHEKHLDHLVRVVPLLCFAYGVQSYMMLSFARGGSTGLLIFTLGISLAVSVMALVTYDYKSIVRWNGEQVMMKSPWNFEFTTVAFQDIQKIDIIGEEDEFQTVIIKVAKKSYTFYFVDNAFELKKTFESLQAPLQHAA
jgi:hypothetical protein